jgi:cyclophilin family peptidyl-prolyl cis-trans isomerase
MGENKKGLMDSPALLVVHGAAAQLSDGLYEKFNTTLGSFTRRLNYAEAPFTYANLEGLTDGTKSWIYIRAVHRRNDPFYYVLIFHPVVDAFMIHGGECKLTNTPPSAE